MPLYAANIVVEVILVQMSKLMLERGGLFTVDMLALVAIRIGVIVSAAS